MRMLHHCFPLETITSLLSVPNTIVIFLVPIQMVFSPQLCSYTRVPRAKGSCIQVQAFNPDLLSHIESLQKKLDDAQTRESHYYDRMIQEAQQRRDLESRMERGRFIAVLINGNHKLFRNDLLLDGLSGGIEAGKQLRASVRSFHECNPLHRAQDKILVYISADLKHLSQVCGRSDDAHVDLLRRFFVGLNQSDPLTTFVDSGDRSNSCDSLKAMFEFHLQNKHCQHVFFAGFAGCADCSAFIDAFAVADPEFPVKVTELRTTKDRPWTSSQHPLIDFDNILCDVLDVRLGAGPLKTNMTRAAGHYNTAAQNQHPESIIRMPSQHRPMKRLRSDDSTDEDAPPPAYKDLEGLAKYTRIANSPEYDPRRPSMVVEDVRPPQVAFVNQYDQRLDLPVTFDRQFLRYLFIEKPKLCNNHYLRGFCGYGNNCKWDHSVDLSPMEINSLRQKARTSACCDPHCIDAACTLGHECRRPSGQCRMEDCKFLPEQHDLVVEEVFEVDPKTMTRRKSSIAPFRKTNTNDDRSFLRPDVTIKSESSSSNGDYRNLNGIRAADEFLNGLEPNPESASRRFGRKNASDYFD
ncbi:uncharacterized protein AB675_8399 [Cyphellophora attinorum]|uniref:C3H1-type domain-containing protein n=1 Tax=Cyphellophora attinorum TaxID=1664694 RepID=A0A0N0NRC4_9EURO|nr:uncharacterized protein AB675_8399 [Phialophora attinorum]KPI44669.1 hypothetical protein AB675_8399 [Phialophora attinorum]